MGPGRKEPNSEMTGLGVGIFLLFFFEKQGPRSTGGFLTRPRQHTTHTQTLTQAHTVHYIKSQVLKKLYFCQVPMILHSN